MTEQTDIMPPDHGPCVPCRGSGWNMAGIGPKGLEITAPITERRSLAALRDYMCARLLCSECGGSGRARCSDMTRGAGNPA